MSAFRSPQPHGATAAFADAVAAKFGVPYAKSWLSDKTCRFTDTTVFTIALGRDRLRTDAGDLAAQHGVRIEFCPDVTQGFRRECDSQLKKGKA